MEAIARHQGPDQTHKEQVAAPSPYIKNVGINLGQEK